MLIFLSCVIFDQQLKITFRKSSDPSPPEKNNSPLFTHSNPSNNSKSTSSPFLRTLCIPLENMFSGGIEVVHWLKMS